MQAIEYTTNAQNGIITLQLPVKKKEVRIIVIWDNEDENVAPRNYDINALENLVCKAKDLNAFNPIKDPVEWQKQIRNEW
ncbi:MAG: hypothetical protein A2275_07815 [Bacteroidetes bacterium RIFOXYA12_FULL_35_11]|nr:MAG: hypothetical protein A2X01_18310 [Bacteroidetes bacterium GWF2_35_48]OFY76432.1 MAG: hypothetical protein A2275_07815 [Bacteroidetes bacterium RIFOXYA12_FULL_35_11]OFY94425.1 MAG: hypothetical protein A2309_03155 [Bacteroidetes bacterium RIFOXYB2_FULL_35_7]OFZ00674.1 MAG: hypothetical protein A2491_14955 [Bacteroidetes bacterium RIFOXYC12_FULL_35_7]HBX52427.1 hypothetical protein [Bacteroidales bacterium]